jgi:hypothetical protein
MVKVDSPECKPVILKANEGDLGGSPNFNNGF